MTDEFKKLRSKYKTISVDITQKKEGDVYKKQLKYPKNWQSGKAYTNSKWNSIAILTGKINNIIVIDIDNIDHWNELSNDYDRVETLMAQSGSGGLHYYFKYTDDIEDVKSSSKSFGSRGLASGETQPDDIDVRSNGGNIIAPPSRYYNNNIGDYCEYKWLNELEPVEMPEWMKEMLKPTKTPEMMTVERVFRQSVEEYELNEDEKGSYVKNDIKELVMMLSDERCNDYTGWLNVGICLHNIDSSYLYIWILWSMKSDKYEDGTCEEKWNGFCNTGSGLNIATLLYYAKQDNPVKYAEFMKLRRIKKVAIIKYPNETSSL